MKSIPKNKKKIFIACAIILVIALLSTLIAKHVDNKYANLDSETRRAMKYGQIAETGNYVNYINEDGTTGNECKFVEFSAFFTRDLNNDGYAERIKGTCKDLSATDTLYAEVNVLTKGHLENGKITLNTNNFKWKTAIVEDNIVEGDYIGETSEIRLKNQVQNGSQKLLWGTISPNVGNNINNYSKVNSMTLTGTYVDDDGNRTEISKTVDLMVDWYGTTKTAVNKYYYSDSRYTSYDRQLLDILTAVKENNVELNFKVAVSETNKTLLLQKQVAELTIPEINGYKPTEVLVLDKNVEYNYDEGTSKLTITRSSTVDENGNVTSQISRSNINNVKLVYPLEAYDNITADSMILNIPVVGYNYGYNNLNGEFENPQISTAEGILTVTYSKISGNIWNAYTTVGNYERASSDTNYSRYVVSKEGITNIYNGNVYEDEKTVYPVKWQVTVANCATIKKITLEEQKENDQYKSDRFLNTKNQYISMYDYIKTTGIYFENASTILGNNGWIKLYNAETGSLIETFTSSNWSNFSKDKPYEVDLKSIKIETSNPVVNTVFYVYQIKEIDNELISKEFSKEDFERLYYIYTYMHAKIEAPNGLTYEGGKTTSEIISTYYAYYEMPYSVAKIKVTPDQITNQKTENVDFEIDVLSQNSMERKWKNGVFLIELPEDIINVDIKDVSISDEKVEISSYEVVQDKGKIFIKIYTLNEEEALYKIKINADVTANPLKPTSSQDIKLYSYNENGDNYTNKIEDRFDIDADGKTNDYIGLSSTVMSFVAPSGLLTTEHITNYDDLGSTTIAPNVADIEKLNEARTATINVSITNGYSGTISDILLLGKIPFEGNTYILNEGSLNSQYTANITGEIKIPEKIKPNTVIYYSSNENPSKDLNDESNGWKLAKDVANWKEIKTYLIDLSGYSLEKGENEIFTYEVEVPGGLGYNSVSYSNHAVYYNIDTENGKLATKTEPNKVGIQVVAKYGLQITKNKKADDTRFVNGATYSITTTDNEGNIITKTATTNKDGVLKFSGIYVEREYTLKEVASPSDYTINTEKVKFKAEINEDGELEFKVLEGNFKDEPQLTTDENGNYLVNAKVEDEAKYTLVINKTDENGNPLKDVKFRLTGSVSGKNYTTDKNGVVTIKGLNVNEEYKLQEREAEGYYIDSEARSFKVIRNESGALELVTEDETLKNMAIKEEQGVAQAILTASIQNEKIPTYNLKILKVEAESDDVQDENQRELKPLTGASFKLISRDTGKQKEYTVDEDGYINITDLYEYVEGKNITGKYTLQETKAPDGYTNNAEEINFKATRKEDGNLEVNIENEEKLSTFKSATIEGNTLTLVIEDEPLFKITKIDSETGERLANADFVIYELDENNIVLDFAKDVNGNYVGEKNQYDEYIVTTDENGEIALPLRPGNYRIVEVGFPDGYYEYSTVETFKVNGNVVEDAEEQETQEVFEIYYIEDLVKLSDDVNNGNKYENTTVKLMRTLDFQDDDSYNPDDSNRLQLKTQLTSGAGFVPIGNSSSIYFSGIFDGQGYEIRNLYVNFETSNSAYVGLFGYVNNGAVKNLGVTGSISVSANYCNVGGIAGYVNGGGIINCYNTGEVSVSGSTGSVYTGGIAGYVNDGSITNCYNTGGVSSSDINASVSTGGIAGYVNVGSITNCYNTGEVSSSDINASVNTGGIVGYVFYSSTNNCYNVKNVISIGSGTCCAGGIAGNKSYGSINNCYYLDSIVITGKTISNYGEAESEADMKAQEFVSVLGASYWSLDVKNINNGYPILNCKVNKIKEINYIEDLVELSNQVNAGVDYSGIEIKLTRTLDFEDYSSYRNSSDISYGDLNGNGNKQEGIKNELTNKADGCCGFTPIGNSRMIYFSGVFDGQGYEIKNLYVNSSSIIYAGLFGSIKNSKIEELGVSGNVSNTSAADNYVGGIVGYLSNSSIIDCYSTGQVSSSNGASKGNVGGIAGLAHSSNIIDCYSTNIVSGSGGNSGDAGGIAGCITNSKIINCYNGGAISGKNNGYQNCVGGIAGDANNSNIINCYNTGNIHNYGQAYQSNAGGIAGDANNSNINSCYNNGDIDIIINHSCMSSSNYNAGGIAGHGSNINNCYNIGDVNNNCNNSNDRYIQTIRTGGISGYASDGNISNCYNIGNASSSGTNISSNTGGISGYVANGIISNCYYIDKIVLTGMCIDSNGEAVSDMYMKSEEYHGLLNKEGAWLYVENNYPKLLMNTDINIVEKTELTIENTMKKFKITTDILELNGVKGGSITGEDEDPYETVLLYESNQKEIVMTPSPGYGISSITINGELIGYTVSEDRTYTIPAEYFKNMQEDKHIVVAYRKLDQILTINKEDTEDSNKKLKGAKFNIQYYTDFVLGDIKSDSTYKFVKNGDRFESNNSKVGGSTANSYFEIDLSEQTGTYTLVVNASISSEQNYDYGYATIKTSTVAPTYSENNNNINTSYRFIYESGTQSYFTRTVNLIGGKKYYLHLGYKKDGSVDKNDDKFVINSISLSGKIQVNKEVETNELGQIRVEVPSDTELNITELQAPDGYTLNNEPITYTMKTGEENILTIANKRKTSLIVHHYFKDNTKDNDEEKYTTLKVAEDEYQEGDIGEVYTTSPRFDLDNLYLSKTLDGKYELPGNETGTFTEEPIEVTYYYEMKPINLKINHYLNGTDIKLADERTEEFDSEITFNEDGTYKVTTKGSYEINTNDDYKDLIKSYELVKIESSVNPTLNSNDTLEFTENTELRYYYKLKDNIITTEVKEHTENRTNPVTNLKEETKVKGGTITGENKAPYEIVEDGENSKKEITATPDEGYTIKQIILESIDKDGNKTETIIYGEGKDENAEITYRANEHDGVKDGSITLISLPKDEEDPGEENPGEQKPDDGTYLFKNVTENKHIIVEFEPILSKVVVHHYMVGTGEEYGKDPVYPLLKDGTEAPNEEKQDFVGEAYATKSNENIKDIYKLVSVSGDTSGTYLEDEVKHIYYYYDYNSYAYEIHYFYDGVEDETKQEHCDAKYGEIISEYPDKPEGYIFNKVTPVNPDDRAKANLQITEDGSKNIINVYYGSKYEITTDVIEHTENYKDGTTKQVKGGTITGEDETPYEEVAKYKDNKKAINIVPDKGYEIAKVIIRAGSESAQLNVADYIDDNGKITFPEGYFKDVRNNIHIDVEFRKKTTVTIKYLEEETKEVLATEEKVIGTEGEKYTTSRKPIEKYKESSLGVTYEDENLTKFDETKDNIMYADSYTIIYWYKKVESGIIVRHIEINEKDKKQGLTLESGLELDEETFTGNVDDTKETSRKTDKTDEKYKNYIPVNGPEITEGKDETSSGDENEDGTTGNVKNIMIIVAKDEDSKTGTFKENEVVEIRYYYEKQYNITTEVKPHDEQTVNTETGETETTKVDGGTISGNKQDSYEKVLNMGTNKEAIVITPDNKYKVKQVTVNGKKIDITKLENESHIVTIPKAYFKEVDEDKHIVVEFEKIPAKVIVEYRDVDTKEEIKENKTIGGVVDDEYKVERPEIKDYITADPEPKNATGTMTEETIIVTYWYTKQFKITTDVIEHFEETNGEVISKKGGEITGEDLLPYETVNRGKNNTLAITMKPEKGYRIAEIKINGKTLDYSNDENIIITEDTIENATGNVVEKVTQKTVEIPVEYFKNMQEDKHITVSYERIPTKVIVKYLEEGTDKPLSDETNEYGYVYDKYETKEKDIEYYELVKEKYPQNSTGTFTEETITVKYYYRKLKFNMKVEKEIGKITLNGENVELTSSNKLANIKIDYKDINDTNLEVTYKIKVTNTEKVAGTATIEELIPEGFELVVEQSDIGWKIENGRYILETEEIKPGETKEYNVTLRWIPEENNKGQKKNTAKITNTDNVPDYEETTKADNEDEAEVNIQLNKTIKEIIGDIADGKINDVVKDVISNVKTGDTIVVSVFVLAVAGIAIVVTIIKKNKSSKEN